MPTPTTGLDQMHIDQAQSPNLSQFIVDNSSSHVARNVALVESANAMEVLEWLEMKRDTRWRRAPHLTNYMWSKHDQPTAYVFCVGFEKRCAKNFVDLEVNTGVGPNGSNSLWPPPSSHQSQLHDLLYQESSLSSRFVPRFAHSVSHPTTIRCDRGIRTRCSNQGRAVENVSLSLFHKVIHKWMPL